MTDKPHHSDKLSGMAFGEALERFTRTDPKELAIVTNATMKDGEIERLIAAFEAAARFDENGIEYWTARSLQNLLGYSDYRNFLNIIEKAKTSCKTAGQPISDHFVEVTEMVELGSGATRGIDDIRLSRYACYLITQNGDAKKKPIAFGQTYFAIQTRRQEISDQSTSGGVAVPQSEDEKRVFLRNQIKEHNRYLSSAAKDAGVVTPQEFAIFHSKGYKGLYGKTVPEIRKCKGLSSSSDILDRMGSTELAANFFRVTQTEEKLRKDKIKGLEKAYATHYAVGRQVRDAMLKISGIAPEDLPAVESIKQAEKRLKLESKDAPPKLEPVEEPRLPAPQETQAEDRHPIDLRKDLWKFALLILATKPNGEATTAELISELPNYILVPEGSQEVLSRRKDSKFSQLVRNLKSHKTAKTNFIYQGYAQDIPNGFRISERGRDFVKRYFSE
ncbi:MAG: DNA damage-inducible protein D [Alphaproteobacteria bacterium RIFOXYD12_FULL_60_8]|nr:MAG: DNA damage-inducible protein D [Alphaproteobacteria bacterium RIFOXYD12_FULL_60_8]